MISRETRYRAVVHYNHFLHSLRRVSRLYGVSKSSLQRWVHANPATQPQRTRNNDAFSQVRRFISEHIKLNPFCTMDELAAAVKRACGIRRARSTIGAYRRRAGFTRKKAFRVVDTVLDAQKATPFCQSHLQTTPDQLVCIDEAGFYVGDHPRMGYAAVGRRLNIMQQRTLRRKKYTLLLAVTTAGILHYKVLDHNCKKPDFIQFISELPVTAGKTLLMDNVRFHHSVETRRAVADKGCTQLFIPPYSPRFNAIENVFGVLKTAFRRRCPPHADTGFDYRSAMVGVLEDFRMTDLSLYFCRSRDQSVDTLASINAGRAVVSYEF